MPPTLYIIVECRVNLNKLSRNFVGALRITTTDCRVSFIDLYLVFPRNFRIVFSPYKHCILLELYCGTITEPGLPVVKQEPTKASAPREKPVGAFHVAYIEMILEASSLMAVSV